MTERFIEHFRLVDAFARDGCPVCRCLVDDSRRHLETLMYEHVTDAEIRRALRASSGFCNWHTWMLRTVSNFGFGAAIIHEDLLERTPGCWRALLGDLGGFLGKHDYRRREEFTEAEAASLARVFETLAGAAGVFGNDVQAPSASAHDKGGR